MLKKLNGFAIIGSLGLLFAGLVACSDDKTAASREEDEELPAHIESTLVIDENGEVILGQNISKIKEFMEEYNNAGIDKQMLQDTYSNTKINDNFCASSTTGSPAGGNDGRCIVKHLLNKIGTKARVTDEGLCRAVLEKCQYYSYDKNKNYIPYNDIVVNYIQRAMVNIRAAQYNIISEYASSCMVDVANCYNQQVTQVNSWSSSASISSIYNVMKGACRDVALTCAFAVFDDDPSLCSPSDTNACINSISEMFYNSMLCAEGEQYDKATGKCHNVKNKVEFVFNGLADGFDDPANTISYYLEKDKPFKLPTIGMLKNHIGPSTMYTTTGGLDKNNCNLHNASWCYMVSATEIKCESFAEHKKEPGGRCTGDYLYNNTVKTNIEIPVSDVNLMIANGIGKVSLGIASTFEDCTTREYTYWDERGCTCVAPSGYDSSTRYQACPKPVGGLKCPSGYIEYQYDNSGNNKCLNINIKQHISLHPACFASMWGSNCNEEDLFEYCSLNNGDGWDDTRCHN